MLLPGASLHTSSMTSKSVGVASRSATEKVTVFFEIDPEGVESIGTPNSIVIVAPVDSHGMTTPWPEVMMPSRAADIRTVRELCRKRGRRGSFVCP